MKTHSTSLLVALGFWGWTTVLSAAQTYAIVDTGQTRCYGNHSEIAPPRSGEPFRGQDAQFRGHPASYSLSADGLTVRDNVTGLTWQRSPDTDGDSALTRRDKLTLTQAEALPARLNSARFGGFSDWRLPTIKELYSLFDARGTDPSGPSNADTSGLTPFIDTNFFKFAYGNTSTGERVIDSQYATSTRYVGTSARGFGKLFGVNFADGRIKGYDLQMPGGGAEKTFFVQCVRGNPAYGKNDFHDNGDGTVADRATGLIWSKDDSGAGMNWQEALAWVEKKNAEKALGHGDWRLPSVKELQSIVDYTRSPDTSHSPALDPVFNCTAITNEAHAADYPYFWSATTHAGIMGGGAAMYVAFGRAAGWMSPRSMASGPPDRRAGPDRASTQGGQGDYHYVDVHGAGSQRSDPKSGDAGMFPHGRGPQGDVIRINNFARLVRGGDVVSLTTTNQWIPPAEPAKSSASRENSRSQDMNPPAPPSSPIVMALDVNGDGVIGADELAKAGESLRQLDQNKDGKLTLDEYRPRPRGGQDGPSAADRRSPATGRPRPPSPR